MADVLEVQNWSQALNRKGSDFPYINSLKSLTGHNIGATGAIETIAAALQLKHQFLHPSLNCEDLHPEIARFISDEKVPHQPKNNISLQYIIKSSFGFGDTNAVLILKNI
jgi:3-oxoacyl-(acyl-carrier-protein) synthase